MKSLKTIFVFALLMVVTAGAQAQIAVKGDMVYTMEGEVIENGVVLIKSGKIERVGEAARIRIPGNYEVYEAKVVTPGFVDAHSVVGLAGYYNVSADQDQLERSDAIQPELRAIDAFNARERLVSYLLEQGITTVHTGHGPGAVISGQTLIAKTYGENVEESVLEESKMLAMTLGSAVRSNFSTPGTRAKAVAMLRQALISAQDYKENGKSRKLDMEVLVRLLDGELTAMITAHKANDIMTALRIQEEFGFKMVLDGAAEAYLVMDEIKEAGVPVFVHPPMIRLGGDAKNASLETPAKLHEAGIPFAFQSGFEGYVPKTRVIRYEAAIAAAFGLGMENALVHSTIEAARILGIDDRVGSLKRGKDADLVLFDGDPFEYTTHVTGVIVNGEKVK